MNRICVAAMAAACVAPAYGDVIDFEGFTAGTVLDGSSAINGLFISGARVVDAGTNALDDIVSFGQFAMADAGIDTQTEITIRTESAAGLSRLSFNLFLDDADGFDGGTGLLGAEAVTLEGTFANGDVASFTIDADFSFNDDDVFGDFNVNDDRYEVTFLRFPGPGLTQLRIFDSGRRFGIDNLDVTEAPAPVIPLPTAGLMAAAGGLLVVRSRRRG